MSVRMESGRELNRSSFSESPPLLSLMELNFSLFVLISWCSAIQQLSSIVIFTGAQFLPFNNCCDSEVNSSNANLGNFLGF